SLCPSLFVILLSFCHDQNQISYITCKPSLAQSAYLRCSNQSLKFPRYVLSDIQAYFDEYIISSKLHGNCRYAVKTNRVSERDQHCFPWNIGSVEQDVF